MDFSFELRISDGTAEEIATLLSTMPITVELQEDKPEPDDEH